MSNVTAEGLRAAAREYRAVADRHNAKGRVRLASRFRDHADDCDRRAAQLAHRTETTMTTIGRHTDSKGRSTGERVAAIQRGGSPTTEAQHTAATRLLDALLDAAADHDVTLDDLDWVTDLPGACLDVIRTKTRNGR
jgi:hypothetical protein